PGLMHSKARLTYDIVARVVEDRDRKLRKEWAHVAEELDNLYKLYKRFDALRHKRGTINFEFPEPLIHFDDNQRIQRVSVRERNVAHRMIEECMLAANVCAGELIQDNFGNDGIYRNHAGPEPDSLEVLRAFLKGLGLQLGGGNEPDAGDYSELLKKAAARPLILGVVQSVLLRSLSQAVYSPEQIGHFALAFPVYTHFTSPIRRYPDLVVHRLIRNIIDDRDRPVGAGNRPVAEIGEHCSFTDRRAEDATRDVISWLKAEFMEDKIGQEFDGVISGVKEFGVFVQLDDIFVDGLVHVTALGSDYYRFDPVNLQLTGDRSGRRFKLGDRIRIVVSKVNLDQAKIDFELTGTNAGEAGIKDKPRGTRATKRTGAKNKTKARKPAAKKASGAGSRKRGKTGGKQGGKTGGKRGRQA
ncbi:MAG: RNB domain-containing ribonuclease, partial [Gammaproteobacteria bacterium]|nr:RNB domain-containing ribonuclease [Gammaproteobacteria bacterium]